MSMHTPQPWEYVGGAIVGPKLDDHETWLRPVVARFATGVSLANLNLMLAAPELLEALQEMHILYGCKYDKDMIRKDAIALDVIDKARAAIAKATGEHK